MKKKEIKKMTKSQALKDIDKFKKDLFNFRFQKINSQVTNASKIKETKKNIARIISQVLNLGAIEKDGKVVLVQPSQKVENGLEIA